MTERSKLWPGVLKGLVAALVANLAVRWLALMALDIPTEFVPLSTPVPTILFTTMGVLGAAGVFGVVRRKADDAEHTFRSIAILVLILSLVPDLWLLTEGAAETFPGATAAGVVVLMVMHVATAAIIVWGLLSVD